MGLGSQSNASSTQSISNKGSNTNKTSISQPITPVYNVNVTNGLPSGSSIQGSQAQTIGSMTDGVVNSVNPLSSLELNNPTNIIIAILIVAILLYIFYKVI
jgi:hypothetical protein